MPNVYTGGTFDLFHSGHVRLLKRLKQIAGNGKVIVAINPDDFIEKFKGKKPIMSELERYDLLSACKYVDEVRINKSGEDSKPTILMYPKPDIVAIGSDWAARDYYKQMDFTEEWLDQNDIVLIYVPYTEGISTTDIKERIKNG
jgi:glycerol-3-phosphate cytidylyltransferase